MEITSKNTGSVVNLITLLIINSSMIFICLRVIDSFNFYMLYFNNLIFIKTLNIISISFEIFHKSFLSASGKNQVTNNKEVSMEDREK